MERGFQMPPFKTATINLYESVEKKKLLGHIARPFDVSNIRFTLHGSSGETFMHISSPRCTGARFWGKLPCQSCRSIEFLATDPKDDKCKGRIASEWKNCCQDMMLDLSQYHVNVGGTKTDIERALLIVTGVFIDLNYHQFGWNFRDACFRKLSGVTVIKEIMQSCASKVGAFTRKYA
eukprot:GHVO01017862.1.p1 GENE.GHVO01017862.1~~GHVO01017862.1.p1  ORF type:complete len:185 (-),score=24.99 GHVO01017862.1:136-669(-)